MSLLPGPLVDNSRAHQSKQCILLALYSLRCIKTNVTDNRVISFRSGAAVKYIS